MLSVSMSVSLEIGIGIDLSLGFAINVQNFDEAFNGWTTSYVEFVDPAAAQARADRAIDLSQQLSNMVIYQQKIVSDVLAGGYNANPDAIAQMAGAMPRRVNRCLQHHLAQGYRWRSFPSKGRLPSAASGRCHADGHSQCTTAASRTHRAMIPIPCGEFRPFPRAQLKRNPSAQLLPGFRRRSAAFRRSGAGAPHRARPAPAPARAATPAPTAPVGCAPA